MLGSLFQSLETRMARKCEGQIERLTLICTHSVADALRRGRQEVSPKAVMLQPTSLVYFKAANRAICSAFSQDDSFRLAQDAQTVNERLGGSLTRNDMEQLENLLKVGMSEFKTRQVSPLARAVWCGATIGNLLRERGVSSKEGYVYAVYVCGLADLAGQKPGSMIAEFDEIMRRKMAD